jgi:hypothetical protein
MIPIIFVIFGDMDSAANAALTVALDCPRQYECGGVIYEDSEHHYHVSAPLTSHKHFGLNIPQYTEGAPEMGWRIVADYHTHICSQHNRLFANFFSASDAYVNQAFHTVGYMLSLCDGHVRRYDPSQDDRDDEVVHFTSGREIYLTCGHITGWIEEARAPALDAWALAARAARHGPELADGALGLWHASSQNEYNGHHDADAERDGDDE